VSSSWFSPTRLDHQLLLFDPKKQLLSCFIAIHGPPNLPPEQANQATETPACLAALTLPAAAAAVTSSELALNVHDSKHQRMGSGVGFQSRYSQPREHNYTE
jgi:hypothetical protein